jgi:hypothetical protein
MPVFLYKGNTVTASAQLIKPDEQQVWKPLCWVNGVSIPPEMVRITRNRILLSEQEAIEEARIWGEWVIDNPPPRSNPDDLEELLKDG